MIDTYVTYLVLILFKYVCSLIFLTKKKFVKVSYFCDGLFITYPIKLGTIDGSHVIRHCATYAIT